MDKVMLLGILNDVKDIIKAIEIGIDNDDLEFVKDGFACLQYFLNKFDILLKINEEGGQK